MARTERLPTFLNYTRSITPSEGLLFGLVGDREVPVEVIERTVRGSISSYVDEAAVAAARAKAEKEAGDGKAAKAVKVKDTANANIQRIDVAHLPQGATHLVLRFSLVVVGNAALPSGCNSVEMRNSLVGLARTFRERSGFRELAERYAWNLVNGRVLWRNRVARAKRVEISLDGGEPITFSADNVSTFRYDRAEMPARFDELVAALEGALASPDGCLHAEVRVVGALPSGAEVYPSQAFIEKEKGERSGEGDRTKLLSSVPATVGKREVRQAIMHSQKLGNAIRTIDDWHPQAEDLGVVAVEAYGYVQHANKVVRQESRKGEFGAQGVDLYELLKDVDGLARRVEQAPEGRMPDEALYFFANLVKGGVFSGSKEVKPEAAAKADKPAKGAKGKAATTETAHV